MKTHKILEEVNLHGYSRFNLNDLSVDALNKLNLDELDDGFHLNNDKHSQFVKDCVEVAAIVKNIQDLAHEWSINWNEINITRVVKSMSAEKYRTHFDSHLFTLVIPLRISNEKKENKGQLYLVPNLRRQPKSDLINFFQKLMTFRYRGEKSFKKLRNNNKLKVFDLRIGEAILFNGSRSLHGNLANDSDQTRITLITHMVDPFPNGFGALLRKIRKQFGLRK